MKTDSDSLMNFSDCSSNVFGEGSACSSELSEWPIQQQEHKIAGLFNIHVCHQDLGINEQVASAARRLIGKRR